MTSSPILNIEQVAPTQNDKTVTINDAVAQLEAATNAPLEIDMTAGNVTLSFAEFSNSGIFKTTSLTANRTLTIPLLTTSSVPGPAERLFVIRNPSSFDVTVGGTSGATATIGATKTALLISDGVDCVLASSASGTGGAVDLVVGASGTVTLANLEAGGVAPSASPTLTGTVDMTGATWVRAITPVAATDVVIKSYVDGMFQGFQFKPTATVVSAANLTGTYVNGTAGLGATFTLTATGVLTIDGHAIALNDLVLFTAQTSAFQNGLYVVTVAGAVGVAAVLTRHVDMDTALEFSGAFIPASNAGTAFPNTVWLANPSGTVTVGTTAIPITQIVSPGATTGSAGITISGTTASLSAIADKRILANISGGSTAPTPQTLSDILDNIIGLNQGAILVRGASGWDKIVPGTIGQALFSQGTSSTPAYGDLSGSLAIGANLTLAAGLVAVQASPTFTATAGTLPLVINGNSIITTGNIGGTLLRLMGAPASSSRVLIDSIGATSAVTFRRGDGTAGTLTAVQTGESIGVFSVAGYGATAYGANRVFMQVVASENWTDTAQGFFQAWNVVASGGTALAEAMRLQASGILSIGTTGVTGSNKLQVIGGTSTDTLTVGGSVVVTTTVTTGPVVINSNTAFASIGLTGELLEIQGSDSITANVVFRGFGAGGNPRLAGYAASGTQAAPTALISGSAIFQYSGIGYNGTVYVSGTGVNMLATENWSGTANGTGINFNTINTGTTVATTKMSIRNQVMVGTTVPTGTNNFQVIGGIITDNLRVTGTIDTSFPVGRGMALTAGLIGDGTPITLTGTAGGTLSFAPTAGVHDIIVAMPGTGGTVTLTYAGVETYQFCRAHIKNGATVGVLVLNAGTVNGFVFGSSESPTSFTLTGTANTTDMFGVLGITTAYARFLADAKGFTA